MQTELFSDAVIAATAKNPAVTYCTVKFSLGWLPGAIGFTEQAKTVLAERLGVDKKIIRGSYAILGAGKDPLIQEGAALKRLLTTIRDSFTIPEYTLVASSMNLGHLSPEKVKGSYLIEACKVDEFLTRFNEVRDQYLLWGKRVADPENYLRIRTADSIGLAQDWEVIESKYPTAEALADSITCDLPRIEPFNASFTLNDVAPATAERLRGLAENRLEASVSGAISEFVNEFKTMVEAVSKNCGKRVRLLPIEDEWISLRNAEVQQILRSEDNPAIPAGMLLVTVQPCSVKEGESMKFLQNGKATEYCWTEDQYKALRPYETDEYRVLTQSGFDNLTWMAQRISTVKAMLGKDAQAKNLVGLVDEVSNTLSELGGSASAITRELKNSGFARNSLRQTFQKFSERLGDQATELREIGKVKRKIKLGGSA